VEQRQQRLGELHEELNQSALELDALVRQQAELRSRLSVLEQLDTSHEGFSAGALAALKKSKAVLGSLSDQIRVPGEYVPAIEAALGHYLQLVLTEQPESAQQILADLAANKNGRASIAALDLAGKRSTPSPFSDDHWVDSDPRDLSGAAMGVECGLAEAACGETPSFRAAVRAASVVEADAAVRPLVDRLLGLTRIVPDLAAATAAWSETNGAFDFVTQGGELLTRHGVFTGGYLNGSASGRAPTSILGRKNQIAELHRALVQLQEQVNEASRHKGGLQSEQTALQASLQEAQGELRAQEVAIATHEGEFNALQTSLRSLGQKIETVVYEIQSLAAHDQEGQAKRAALAAKAAEFERREQAAQTHVSESTAALEGGRQQRSKPTRP
jgi:chromosome segregation protein